jgi:hypothetical protein
MEIKTKNGTKNYTTVNERVKTFIKEKEGWAITTEAVFINNDACAFKCTVYDTEGRVRSTGYAQEDRSSSYINKTSYVENCETSAVGRALGFLGIGIDESISTYDEVSQAIQVQNQMEAKEKALKAKPRITRDQADNLEHWIIDTGTDANALLGYFKVKSTLELAPEQYEEAMKILRAKKR